jgi:hypothetical protein
MIKQRLDRAEMCRKCAQRSCDAYENTHHPLGQTFFTNPFRENLEVFQTLRCEAEQNIESEFTRSRYS